MLTGPCRKGSAGTVALSPDTFKAAVAHRKKPPCFLLRLNFHSRREVSHALSAGMEESWPLKSTGACSRIGGDLRLKENRAPYVSSVILPL